MEAAMTTMWLGTLAFGLGVVYLLVQAVWHGPLSRSRLARRRGVSLEPPFQQHELVIWPGVLLLVVGLILLLYAMRLPGA
jgi:protein-S-isoprenylcysteine O-methyltransferase Ste14